MSVPASTIRQSSDLPPYLSAAFQAAAERGLELSRRPYTPYPGQTIAPQSPSIGKAAQIAGMTGAYLPNMQAASQMAGRAHESIPRGYQAYMDPYQDETLRSIAQQGQRLYKEKIMPELDARYINLGQYGSSRHAQMAERAARDIQREVALQQEESMGRGVQQAIQGFDTDRSRALEAANILNKLGISKQVAAQTDIKSLREAAQMEQEQQQRLLDEEYNIWKERERYPYERLAHYFSILRGVPIVPSTYTQTEIPRPSTTMHRRDWRNLAEEMLGDFMTGRLGR